MDESESVAQAGIIVEKIRTALGDPYILKIPRDGQTETTVEHRCSASIGVALFSPHATSQEDVLTRADKVMYQAKEAGAALRNQFSSSGAVKVRAPSGGGRQSTPPRLGAG